MFCNKGAFPFWIGSFGHMWPQQRDSDAENNPAEVTETRTSQRDSVQSLQWLICSQSITNPANRTKFSFVPYVLYFVFPLHCWTKHFYFFFSSIQLIGRQQVWQHSEFHMASWWLLYLFHGLWIRLHISVIKQITHICFFVSWQLEKFLSILSSMLELGTHGY